MLDIKFVRENPEAVRENIRKKFQDAKLPLVDEAIDCDARLRAAITEANELRASRNALSKKVGMLMGQAKKDPSKLEEAEAVKAQVKADAERLAALEAQEAELEEKLRSFYLELVSRVRKLDKNHMFLLNGSMFSSKVHIFDRNFDPECNNWGISIHCYGARPEVASFGSALRKSRELNVPVWMGETGGENEWMSSLYELLLEHHIGFNIWCWKSAEGSGCAGTLRFQLPEGWELIRNYAENGVPNLPMPMPRKSGKNIWSG